MQFPVYDTAEMEAPKAVLEALGIGEVVNTSYSPKNKILLIEIASTSHLSSLQPD